MGYVYLLTVAMMFSFGGSCVKLISPYFAPSMISFLRFFVGVFCLLVLKLVRRIPTRADFVWQLRTHWKWLLFGAASKLGAYITENTALALGVSYGNILTQPVQMVLLAFLGVYLLGEVLTARKWTGIAACVVGILAISWNGRSLAAFMNENFMLTGLFVISGCCSGIFVFVQKKVSDAFDVVDSNLVMFATAALLGFPIPLAEGAVLPAAMPNLPCLLAVLFFGFITGIGFYLNAKAIPLVPFYMVPLLQSTMVFFTILWGAVFFHEPISGWIIGGTILFVIGILLMQLPERKAKTV